MTEDDLRTVLSDATLYLREGAAEAALDMLVEEEDGFCRHPALSNDALDLLNQLYLLSFDLPLPTLPARALDALFRLGSATDAATGALDASFLARYKRALLNCETSALPLRRAARHARLLGLFDQTETLDGALAECGCARGLSALQLCHRTAEHRRGWAGEGFHVIDSFEGLSEPTDVDLDTTGMHPAAARRVLSMTRRGNMAFDRKTVVGFLHREFPAVQLHKGWIPQPFEFLPDQRYRFVHVDVDLYEPTLASFRYFHPRLVPGGVIVTDDYNWPGGRRAVDQFCAAIGVTPMLTSSHQAYIVAC